MSVAAELMAGGIAGAAGILTTQPLDTVRIRLQASVMDTQIGKAYAGVRDCTMTTVRAEGLRGLYKGVASPTLTVGVMNAILFFTYEKASSILRGHSSLQDGQPLSLLDVGFAGAASGFTTAFINSPTELVKCRAQIDVRSQGHMREEWVIMRNLWRDHGLFGSHGPWRGLLVTISRDTPSFGMYFVFYEAASRSLGNSAFASFMAGGFAGAAAWALIYPVDVLKTRWQTASPGRYTSLPDCFRTTMREDGRGALIRGFGATMLRAWPQNGVIFCTYELVKSMFEPKSSEP